MEQFIKALSRECDSDLQNFANSIDEEKFNLILKLINNESMTEPEMELALNKYRFDIDMQGVLVSAPQIPPEIKKNVVRDFVCESIINPEKERPNEHWFIEMVLKNYKEIEPKELNSLCEHFYEDVINLFNWYDEENQKSIPQTTADIVILNEFALLTCETHRKYYMANYPPLSFISENDTLDYILENMPENAQLAEKITTSIINSPKVSDATKDMLFEKYGCNMEHLVLITPHISNKLYESIADGAYMDNPIRLSGDDVINTHKARYILNYMLRKNLMTDAQQIDLVNRVIADSKSIGSRASNDTLELMARKTTSPKVLHEIIKSSAHTNDKNIACGNEHVSKKDVQAYTHTYIEKIKKKLDSGRTDEMSNKWFYLARVMLKRFELKHEDYETLLRTKNFDTINAMLSTRNTPEDIVKKAIDIVYEKAESDISGGWKNAKIKAIANRKLLDVGLYGDDHIEGATDIVLTMIRHCRLDADLDDLIYHSKYWHANPEHFLTMQCVVFETLNELEYKPENSTKEEFIKNAMHFVEKWCNGILAEKDPNANIDELTTSQISRIKMEYKNKIREYLRNHDIVNLYPFVSEIKDRFVKLSDVERNRYIENTEDR